MYLRLINVKAIERQRDSYILVINNRYEKMGESLYRINKDALEIIRRDKCIIYDIVSLFY